MQVFHAGEHALGADGKLRTGRLARALPLVLHYNGPAKVVFEAAWRLDSARHHPWDPQSGKTPVLLHVEGLRRAHSAESRARAAAAFERDVTLVDPWLQRAEGVGPLRYTCAVG